MNDRDLHMRLLAESLSERYGIALLAGDAVDAEQVVREAYDEELPYGLIHAAVVAPALQRIGLMWERGEIGVAHEHLATQITMRVLALLRELFRVRRARGDHQAMLAAVEGEHHTVALQMSADLLEDAGYDVVLLGPDVPCGSLADIVEEQRPALVALSVTMPAVAVNLDRAVAAARSADPPAEVIVGGRGRPSRRPSPPGLEFCDSVVEVVDVADRMLRRPELN